MPAGRKTNLSHTRIVMRALFLLVLLLHLPEGDRVDPHDLHGLGIVDGGASSGGKRSASQSGEGSSAGVF